MKGLSLSKDAMHETKSEDIGVIRVSFYPVEESMLQIEPY